MIKRYAGKKPVSEVLAEKDAEIKRLREAIKSIYENSESYQLVEQIARETLKGGKHVAKLAKSEECLQKAIKRLVKRLDAENERLRTRLLTHGDIETDAEETLKEEYDELSSK